MGHANVFREYGEAYAGEKRRRFSTDPGRLHNGSGHQKQTRSGYCTCCIVGDGRALEYPRATVVFVLADVKGPAAKRGLQMVQTQNRNGSATSGDAIGLYQSFAFAAQTGVKYESVLYCKLTPE
jgi:hypothetical protein